ncbi:hypothetical protein [Paenibacillus alkalitolerans]|uniref:hypothetical protein n=1 Tax=Paenibacillus alkalitolerans TaxID=2799335 RepID=UPI0018F455DE|nr:hypothetical protein [Paenibacillus alkalitolerans]
MERGVTKQQVKSLVGKHVIARKKDGTLVSGKLVKIQGNQLLLRSGKGKTVKTKALLPLVLFDLAAIGASPYVYGPYAYSYGGGYPWYGYPGTGYYGGPYFI